MCPVTRPAVGAVALTLALLLAGAEWRQVAPHRTGGPAERGAQLGPTAASSRHSDAWTRLLSSADHNAGPRRPSGAPTAHVPSREPQKELTRGSAGAPKPDAGREARAASRSKGRQRRGTLEPAKQRPAQVGASSELLVEGALGQRLSIPCQAPKAGPPNGTSPGEPADLGPRSGLMAGGQSSKRPRVAGQSGAARNNQANQQQQQRGLALIVWHKDGQLDAPIFVADFREASTWREARQEAHVPSLQGRARLELATAFPETPQLVIDEAAPPDAGLYTCSLEFHKAPTQTHRIRVRLLTPPRNLAIRDETADRPLAAGIIGPYDEGSRLSLGCRAEFPAPNADQAPSTRPELSWWRLSSVSALPATAGSWAWPAEAGPDSLLTVAAPLELGGGGARVDYFVAESSSSRRQRLDGVPSAAASLVSELLALAPDESAQLRFWTRVTDVTLSNSSASSDGWSLASSSMQLAPTRSNLGDEFMCLARNNDFVAPLNSTVKINLNLRPTEVMIVNKANYTFKLGQELTVECQIYGSKPSARVTWFRGQQEIEHGKTAASSSAGKHPPGRPATMKLSKQALNEQLPALASARKQQQLESDQANTNHISEFNRDISNLTKSSYLTLIPQLSDNQQNLACSAHNPKMGANVAPLSDSLIMNVQFPAQLSLQFGANIKPEAIRLGGDVFMDCNIQANPPIDDLTWLFNERVLTENATAGIHMSNKSLIIQRIRIEHRGQYQCIAQNAMGRSRSNKLHLKPKFAPVCDTASTRAKYEASVGQPVKIECAVIAEPDREINFEWKFNQSSGFSFSGEPAGLGADANEEPIKRYETNFTRSHIFFTPSSRHHFGFISCRASNVIGLQEKPCLISIVPSELPDPILSCFFDNFTQSSFEVHCQANENSPNKQSYVLELYNSTGRAGPRNLEAGDEQAGPATTSMTHLRQRQGDQDQLEAIEGFASDDSMADEEQHARLGQQPAGPHQRQKGARRAAWRRSVSDTPSFHLNDLKPDTSYNILIYVQNSKGRSRPIAYQRSTAVDSAAGDGEGRSSAGPKSVQFINRRLGAEQTGGFWAASSSLGRELYSYLRVQELLSGENGPKPIMAIVLAMTLCTMSVVILALLIGRRRSCWSGARTSASLGASGHGATAKRRKRRKGRGAGAPVQEECSSAFLGLTTRAPAGSAEQAQANGSALCLTAPLSRKNDDAAVAFMAARLKGLAGSASDSSRETNTETTPISGSLLAASQPRPDSELLLGPSKSAMLPQKHEQRETGADELGQSADYATWAASLARLAPESRSRGAINYASPKGSLMLAEARFQPSKASISTSAPVSREGSSAAQQSQHPAASSASPKAVDGAELELSNTPQVSIQSGSECTSSAANYEPRIIHGTLDGALAFGLGQPTERQLQQLLINRAASATGSPLYIISHDGATRARRYSGSHQGSLTTELPLPQQYHQLAADHSANWPANSEDNFQSHQEALTNGSLCATQMSSSLETTGDSFDMRTNNFTSATLNRSCQEGHAKLATCHLFQPPEGHQSIGHILPNSLSIPLALSECPHMHDADAREYPNSACLALAPATLRQQQAIAFRCPRAESDHDGFIDLTSVHTQPAPKNSTGTKQRPTFVALDDETTSDLQQHFAYQLHAGVLNDQAITNFSLRKDATADNPWNRPDVTADNQTRLSSLNQGSLTKHRVKFDPQSDPCRDDFD